MNERSLISTQLQLIKNQQAIEAQARRTPPPRTIPRPPKVQREPAGKVFADQMIRAELNTLDKDSPKVLLRSPDTAHYNLKKEHPWVFMRAGLTDWIHNPALAGYGGLGDYGPGVTAEMALSAANKAIADRLPSPVKAAIDASPLTSAQKRALKREPLTFFVIMADFSADMLIEFIRRVQLVPGAKSSYRIGGKTVRIVANKSIPPAKLAAEFLSVCNQNPGPAVQIAAQMALELGVNAPLAMTSAAAADIAKNIGASAQAATSLATSLAQQAGSTIQQAGKTAAQTQQAAQQAGQNIYSAVTSWMGMGGYAGFGDMGVVSGPVAVAAGTGGTAAAAGGMTVAEIVGLVTAGIGLAGVIVPPLLALSEQVMPPPPTNAQLNEAAGDATTLAPGAIAQVPEGISFSVAQHDKVFGVIPRDIAIWGGVVAVFGAGLFAYTKIKKK